jgi:phosphoglycolate phosphatase-like HAD superfamily hydrolase
MLREVAQKNGYVPGDIWFVGDRRTDMIAGNRFGCRTVLVNDANYVKTLRKANNEVPDFTASDLYDAVTRIILPNGT